mmetsp:Transcript_16848/g.30591  ORF Transcript_16848/g.30591 Transcript_16848/m.30591 type:complete len:121 (-) Transcript_16848:2200-2562(-)
MSESNHNNRNPKMEAPAANIVVPAAKDDCSKGEFIVHTKHTCDTCFQQPIIGRRYTSSVHSNFDLCARCFDAYSGPEISLTEAVLSKCHMMMCALFSLDGRVIPMICLNSLLRICSLRSP